MDHLLHLNMMFLLLLRTSSEKNNEPLLRKIKESNLKDIEDAVKRALEENQASSSKKQKKDPDFKSKGNKLRYEANEEIKEKLEESIRAINGNKLENAKAILNTGIELIPK